MLLNNIKFNTVAVFLWSLVFTWFFFHCKHDLQLSKVNVFNVDPYDAVGSIAVQISLLASLFSMMRLSLLSFTILPSSDRIYPDLIDVVNELYKTVKSNLTFKKALLEKVEGKLNAGKTSAFINWLNPRKHDWDLIILIAILSGIGLAVLEAIGEEWIGFNTKALLLFSIYFGGELIIIALFYRLFRNFLGIVNK